MCGGREEEKEEWSFGQDTRTHTRNKKLFCSERVREGESEREKEKEGDREYDGSKKEKI